MRLRHKRGWQAEGMLGVLCVAIALLWSSATKAETRVYLLRGWFGVFSTGLDTLAAELKSKGIKAETVGHLAWRTTVSNIIKDHASGNSAPLVLVGHSQGANNVIDMARLLQRENIPVDLLITLAPAMQDPIPGNVVRAINYYNSPGWGAPVSADADYHGKLTNINLGGDIGIYHMAIDKNPRIQAEIERAILAVPWMRSARLRRLPQAEEPPRHMRQRPQLPPSPSSSSSATTRSSLASSPALRPGGNLTGINFFANELVAKRLELLRELKPAAARVAVLVNPGTAVAEPQVRDAEAAARVMGLQIHILNAGTIREIEAVFANLARERPDALLVTLDPYLPPGACNWCNWPHATPFPRSMRRAIMPS